MPVDSLRDYIKGSCPDSSTPPWIQDAINDILKRLEQLEKGVGLTITTKDKIVLNTYSQHNDSSGVQDNRAGEAVVPTAGTVKRCIAVADSVSGNVSSVTFLVNGVQKGTLTKSSGSANIYTADFSTPVNMGDVLCLTVRASHSGGGDNYGSAIAIGTIFIELPAETHSTLG